MNTLVMKLTTPYAFVVKLLEEYLQPLLNISGRTYVAWAFFASGLTKIRDWDSTLMLFEYEYAVPLLNFEFAAILATFGELVFPILLIVGLASRFSALALSIINYVAVISLEDIAPAALNGHIIWGLILLYVVVNGGQKLAIDRWVKREISLRMGR